MTCLLVCSLHFTITVKLSIILLVGWLRFKGACHISTDYIYCTEVMKNYSLLGVSMNSGNSLKFHCHYKYFHYHHSASSNEQKVHPLITATANSMFHISNLQWKFNAV